MRFRDESHILVNVLLLRVMLVYGDCGELLEFDNATPNLTIAVSYPTGTAVGYTCNPGYSIEGTSRIYTCSGDQWVGGDFTCEPIRCRYVTPPENGKVTNIPDYSAGSLILFQCNEGYDMVGDDRMVCRTDGEWSPDSPPVCNIKMCGEFGTVQNGQTFQDTSENVRNGYGSVVEVTCDSGYTLVGTPHVKCTADGTWGDKPSCTKLACGTYPGTNSSCVEKYHVLSDSLLVMSCMSGDSVSVTRTGPDTVDCISGEWDNRDGLMACYCDCKIDIDTNVIKLRNLNEKGFLPHDSTLDWTCKLGTKQDSPTITCKDGKLYYSSETEITPECKSISTTTIFSRIPTADDHGSTLNPGSTEKKSEDSDDITLNTVTGAQITDEHEITERPQNTTKKPENSAKTTLTVVLVVVGVIIAAALGVGVGVLLKIRYAEKCRGNKEKAVKFVNKVEERGNMNDNKSELSQ